jgi:hypothetical protein
MSRVMQRAQKMGDMQVYLMVFWKENMSEMRSMALLMVLLKESTRGDYCARLMGILKESMRVYD